MKCLVSVSRGIFLLALLSSLTTRAVTTNFFENFEAALSGWSVRDANAAGIAAYWGIVAPSFGSGNRAGDSRKAYCAGVGFSGATTSAPRYRDFMTAQLDRTVNLTGYPHATLSLRHRLPDIETGYDVARILVDGVQVWSSDELATNWTVLKLNLDAYVGGPHTLRFELRTDESETREGWYLDDLLLTDELLPPAPPVNDDFHDALVLSGCCGAVTGANTNATAEPGEPGGPGRSVWFRWTAMTNGMVTFQTQGSKFDTVLCAYTGSDVTALTPVACEAPGESNNAAGIRFEASAGVTYALSIRGANDAAGGLALQWSQPAGQGELLLPDLSIGVSPSRRWLYGWQLDNTTVPGHLLLRLSTATPNTGSGPLELRGSSSVPGVYQRIYRSDGSYAEFYAGNFTFHPGHGHLHFDNWVNFHLRAVLAGDAVGDIVATGRKTSFAVIDLEAYDLSLPNAATRGVYDDGLIQGISVGWVDIYGSNLQDQWIDVTAVPGGRYWLEAVVDPEDNLRESNESNNVSRILIDFAGTTAPPNDRFTNAFVITGPTAGLRGANHNATRDTGEPAHSLNGPNASIWYRWTAPSNMTVRVSTQGSSIDTLLAVYRGSAVNALTSVASDDDAGGNRTSLLTFTAAAGTTYSIAVDGYRPPGGPTEMGSVQLHFNPAWNDNLSRCLPLNGPDGTVSGSARFATRQAGEPLHAGLTGTNSTWFCWTAPHNGLITFDTIGSSMDTLLAVYLGDTLATLTPVASDDNSAGSGLSRVTFAVTSGLTYRFAVAGKASAPGLVNLNWTYADEPPVFLIEPVGTNILGGASYTLTSLVSGGEPLFYQWFHQDTPIVNSERVTGATSPALTLAKIGLADAGSYRLVVTNTYGAITSAPAALVVLNNSRIVVVEETTAGIGGLVAVPIEMQSSGNEHALNFTLQWDPTLLVNPRLTNGAEQVNATLTADASQAAAGRLGVEFTLPPGETLTAGQHQLARVLFDVPAGPPDGTETGVGFLVPHTVTGVSGDPLPTLFVPGIVTLRQVSAEMHGTLLPGGELQIALRGLAGRAYVIETSPDLEHWTSFSTNRTDLEGMLRSLDPRANNVRSRFYRGRLVP